MMPHSKIAQFNWECTALLTIGCRVTCRQVLWLVGQNIQQWTGRRSIFWSRHFIYLQTVCCARKVNLDRNTWGGLDVGVCIISKRTKLYWLNTQKVRKMCSWDDITIKTNGYVYIEGMLHGRTPQLALHVLALIFRVLIWIAVYSTDGFK